MLGLTPCPHNPSPTLRRLQVREAFGLDHETLTELAEADASGPGCGGVTWLPYLIGERTPCWPHASGALLGLRPGACASACACQAALGENRHQLRAVVTLLAEVGTRLITPAAPCPGPRASNSYLRTCHSTGCLRPGLLYRAAMEGATLSLLAGFRSMVAAGLRPGAQLRLVGGGAKNRLWWVAFLASAFLLLWSLRV